MHQRLSILNELIAPKALNLLGLEEKSPMSETGPIALYDLI